MVTDKEIQILLRFLKEEKIFCLVINKIKAEYIIRYQRDDIIGVIKMLFNSSIYAKEKLNINGFFNYGWCFGVWDWTEQDFWREIHFKWKDYYDKNRR